MGTCSSLSVSYVEESETLYTCLMDDGDDLLVPFSSDKYTDKEDDLGIVRLRPAVRSGGYSSRSRWVMGKERRW